MCPKQIWSQEVFLEYMLYTGVMSNLGIFINFTYEDSMHFYKKKTFISWKIRLAVPLF